jgi:hypothetical protein
MYGEGISKQGILPLSLKLSKKQVLGSVMVKPN